MTEIAAIVMAAGQGRRFGAGETTSKVLADHRGMPLVGHVIAAVRASRAAPLIVVLGHADASVAMAVADDDMILVRNAHYADGLAGSLKLGLSAVPPTSKGALILLGDMPLVATATLDALIAAFAAESADAIVPTYNGQRGNPVLLGRALFAAIDGIEGDEGARRLLKGAKAISTCAVDDPGILMDVDTPDALRALAMRP